MNILLRKMTPDDLPDVIELLSKWNMAPIEPSPVNPDPERDSINIENSFVAVDESRIIGVSSYFLLSEDTAETASLAVDPEYKGKGIGYKLQKARIKEMKERGIKKVRTETDRPETIDWYIRKFGYKIIGKNKKKHHFSLENVEYWTVMELDIGNADKQ